MKPPVLCLHDLADTGDMTGRLTHRGLTRDAAADKADMFAYIAQGLIDADLEDEAPVRAFYVPGRIEVLGKHTDYCGGHSLIAAAERGICFLAATRADALVRAIVIITLATNNMRGASLRRNRKYINGAIRRSCAFFLAGLASACPSAVNTDWVWESSGSRTVSAGGAPLEEAEGAIALREL